LQADLSAIDLTKCQPLSANDDDIEAALREGAQAFTLWQNTPLTERQACVLRFAEQLEKQRSVCLAILCQEAGKTLPDALSEVREAIDFCRYYAAQASLLLSKPIALPGYTGETNVLSLHPRGTIVCISPWNFPLAIFTGQIVAALVTGNCVIAKPAEQTPLMALHAVQWMHSGRCNVSRRYACQRRHVYRFNPNRTAHSSTFGITRRNHPVDC